MSHFNYSQLNEGQWNFKCLFTAARSVCEVILVELYTWWYQSELSDFELTEDNTLMRRCSSTVYGAWRSLSPTPATVGSILAVRDWLQTTGAENRNAFTNPMLFHIVVCVSRQVFRPVPNNVFAGWCFHTTQNNSSKRALIKDRTEKFHFMLSLIILLKQKIDIILVLRECKGCKNIFEIHQGKGKQVKQSSRLTRAIPPCRNSSQSSWHFKENIKNEDLLRVTTKE